MKNILLTLLLLTAIGLSQTAAASQVLGYLQFKTPYAQAAWQEGKMDAIGRVLEHKHSKTGKP